METKKCTKCQEEKPIKFFHKKGESGRKAKCGSCCCIEAQKYKNAETKSLQAKKMREKRQNPDYVRRERDRNNKRNYERRRSDPEYREKKLAQEAANREKNREKRREYDAKRKHLRNELRRKRHSSDLNYKLTNNLRSRLLMALSGRSKASTTLTLLGCSLEEFKLHIENLWEDGMSWGNYGSGEGGRHENCWHLDHIKGCCWFDLTDPKQQKECFHYSNIQPLWGKENLKKNRFRIKKEVDKEE